MGKCNLLANVEVLICGTQKGGKNVGKAYAAGHLSSKGRTYCFLAFDSENKNPATKLRNISKDEITEMYINFDFENGQILFAETIEEHSASIK